MKLSLYVIRIDTKIVNSQMQTCSPLQNSKSIHWMNPSTNLSLWIRTTSDSMHPLNKKIMYPHIYINICRASLCINSIMVCNFAMNRKKTYRFSDNLSVVWHINYDFKKHPRPLVTVHVICNVLHTSLLIFGGFEPIFASINRYIYSLNSTSTSWYCISTNFNLQVV